ncbi:hypothetical protein [Desulforamulus ferrireducens]|uniref:Type 4 fimbrial biogenesis protein PilX N-terminal domain-containing protein n=1 Tax=Desulforamulus ferrireducens TaxID=1833852 RepID=A0A1S6IUM5_9FIRM|nr:hypothetical protein [Desulforamulus ferrireducens]AQS58480.1 hypothetical protein B0537_04900 [Desulforamulus ferrireducens]
MLIIKNQQGYAMLLLMVVISFTVLLGSAALSIATENKKADVLGQQQLQCYYVAASGLEHALARATTELNTAQDKLYGMSSGTPLNDYALGAVAGGIYRVSVERIGSREYKFKSVGTLGNNSKYLEAVIQLNNDMDFSRGIWVGGNLMNSDNLWEQLITINSDVTVKGYTNLSGIIINGNLHSDSFVRLRGVKVKGTLTSATSYVDVDNGLLVDRDSGDIIAAGDVTMKGSSGNIISGGLVTVGKDSPGNQSSAGHITSKNGAVINNSNVKNISTEGNITVLSSTVGEILTNGTANIQRSNTSTISARAGISITGISNINGNLYSAEDISAHTTTVQQNVLGNSVFLDDTEVKGYVFAKSGLVQKDNGAVVRGILPPDLTYQYEDYFIYENQNRNISPQVPSFINNFEWYRQHTPEEQIIRLKPGDWEIEINDDPANDKYNLSNMSGVYIIESDYHRPTVHISGRYRGNLVIVVDGDIYVQGDLQPESSTDSIALIANGDVVLGNVGNLLNPYNIRALIYANNNMSIYGAKITGALIVNGDLNILALHIFNYHTDLVNLPFFNKTKPPFTVIRKEKYAVMREES